jgi:hypothetical protein
MKVPNERDRDRWGCFILAALIALALVLIGLLGFFADPRDRVAEDIPAQPAR